jgi:hypothetical protein
MEDARFFQKQGHNGGRAFLSKASEQMLPARLRELFALSLLAAGGFGLALAQGDLLFDCTRRSRARIGRSPISFRSRRHRSTK